ncbi:hypothetical protein DRW07_05890 [Alteromonas sediminis]|uniref:Uncharacterized protein n=1 Tax=Alteromonas sediminis TaxID=2259342 RepID=A0A3N5YND1_9ALTE|nr:transporter substrate-binding domain-containing protein [Alteromonas sediminis]RPJ67071.1 hypothetical protein DRW07_05890 [Alteromonas sediminis]
MRIFVFAVFVMCTNALANASGDAQQPTFSVCTELSEHADVNNVINGSTTDQVIHAGKRAGIRFTIQYHTWNRCLQLAQNNHIDAIYALFWTSERATFLTFPKGSELSNNASRLRQTRFFFYENIDRPLDLKNLEFGIGAPLGYVARDYLEKQGWLSPIDYSIKEGFAMLGKRKLDAYLIAEEMGDNAIKSLGLQSILRKKQPAFVEKDIHIAFTHATYQQYANQIEEFWSALEAIREQYQ